MSPRDELLTTGRLGEAGATLLYESVRVVAISRHFPPPAHHAAWNEDAVQEVAHDFVQSKRGPKRFLDIALRSTDDQSFRRLLEAAINNHMRDEARRTDLGRLIIRLKELLRMEGQFVEVQQQGEGRWALTGHGAAPSEVSAPELAAATRGVEVVVPNWTSATRNAPAADRESLVRLMTAVLTAANGSLTAADIAYAVGTRIDYRRSPLTVELDDTEPAAEPISSGRDPATIAASSIRALEIFADMSDRERIVVATLDLSVRDLGQRIGTGKTQAAHVRQRLLDHIATELDSDDEPEQTASTLAKMCETWLHDWTVSFDGTS